MKRASLAATQVLYPLGETEASATVLANEPIGDGFAVILDRTPVHPVDHGWPDQPADRAKLEWSGGVAIMHDAILAATDGQELYFGSDIPVKKGAEGWNFLVAHIIPQGESDPPPVGAMVEVKVDADYRRALSLGHTGCHLASLALNHAMRNRWNKEVSLDAVGSPNFDAEANTVSRILERGSADEYRLGKSLRKRGFVTEGLADSLAEIEAEVNQSLKDWVASAAPVRIDREGPTLTDRRYWVCELPETTARIACGGTHATSLSDLGSANAKLTLSEVEGALQLEMLTTVGR